MLKRVFIILYTAVVFTAFLNSAANAGDLKSAVNNRLLNYYDTPFQISVIQPGHVAVKGEVRSYWDKLNVFSIISRVPGVLEISNELAIASDPIPANIIKANIENSLNRTSMLLEPEKIHVAVDNGEVILTGTVSFAREAIAAEDIAAWQQGVMGVANEIQVLPPKVAVSDDNLSGIIHGMLRNDFPLEKDSVTIQVHNGTVTLSGKTTTVWAKNAIAKEVGRIQGVRSVANKIEVKSELS